MTCAYLAFTSKGLALARKLAGGPARCCGPLRRKRRDPCQLDCCREFATK